MIAAPLAPPPPLLPLLPAVPESDDTVCADAPCRLYRELFVRGEHAARERRAISNRATDCWNEGGVWS